MPCRARILWSVLGLVIGAAFCLRAAEDEYRQPQMDRIGAPGIAAAGALPLPLGGEGRGEGVQSAGTFSAQSPETNQPPAPAPISLGLLLPPTEAEAASLRQGVELAVEQANQTNGPRAGVVIRGRPGQWGTDGDEAVRMVTEDGVQALIAPALGASSHLVLQVSGRTAVPVISLCADDSVTGTGVPWMVRLVPRTDEEARAIFSSRAKSSGRSARWGAFVPDGRAGREAARDLLKAAEAAHCTLAKPLEVSTNKAILPRLQKQILETKPEAILLWLDPVPAGRLAKTLRAAGFAGTLAGPGRLRTHDFIAEAGTASEGFLVADIVPDRASEARRHRLEAAYRRRFGAELDWPAAMAYDAAALLIDVLRATGAEPPHRAFPLADAFPGASGPLRFDREGNRLVELQLLICRGGRFIKLGSN